MFIVWDCDGVVFDSNIRKHLLFKTFLQQYDQTHATERYEYVYAHPELTRFQLFDLWYPDDSAYMLRKFNHECQLMYETIPPNPTVCRLAREHDSAIVSNSRGLDVQHAITFHAIDDCFKYAVHGSPATKQEHIQALMARAGIKPNVIVGDGRLDFDTACIFGTAFIFFSPYTAWNEGAACIDRCTTIPCYEARTEHDLERLIGQLSVKNTFSNNGGVHEHITI